ncbi:hypothetical protein, partial [Clostridium perfringens]
LRLLQHLGPDGTRRVILSDADGSRFLRGVDTTLTLAQAAIAEGTSLADAARTRASDERVDITAELAAAHTVRDAYDAKTFSLSASLERQTNIFFQKAWTWSFGAELLASDERDVIAATGAPRRRTFFISALPTSL